MHKSNVLVVDDEQHIIDVVAYVLDENGFGVSTALDGEAALRLFDAEHPDLVILDLGMPGTPGLELFREMRRRRSDAPIIMLTARGEEIDRVLGLELGADDYVTKPFSTRELAARVRAVLRRTRPGDEPAAARVSHGPFDLDVEAFALRYFGQPVQLTRSEFALLECLLRHPARVFTRDVLIDRIYNNEHVVTHRSIDACVKRLRKKLGDVQPELDPVETVHGLGYKLNLKMEDDR